jgi:hypothetical protein
VEISVRYEALTWASEKFGRAYADIGDVSRAISRHAAQAPLHEETSRPSATVERIVHRVRRLHGIPGALTIHGGHCDMKGGDPGLVRSVDWAERFPMLYSLFATHLFQSWSSVHESPAAALREGIDDRTLDELRVTMRELNELRALRLAEDDLHHVLFYDLRSYYRPVGRSQAEWLADVALQLDAAIRKRAAEDDSVDPTADEL